MDKKTIFVVVPHPARLIADVHAKQAANAMQAIVPMNPLSLALQDR